VLVRQYARKAGHVQTEKGDVQLVDRGSDSEDLNGRDQESKCLASTLKNHARGGVCGIAEVTVVQEQPSRVHIFEALSSASGDASHCGAPCGPWRAHPCPGQ
jgi:hypothetical protein